MLSVTGIHSFFFSRFSPNGFIRFSPRVWWTSLDRSACPGQMLKGSGSAREPLSIKACSLWAMSFPSWRRESGGVEGRDVA